MYYYLALRRVKSSRYLLYIKYKHKVLDILAVLDYDENISKTVVCQYYFKKIRYWLPRLKFDQEAISVFDQIYQGKLKIRTTGRSTLRKEQLKG